MVGQGIVVPLPLQAELAPRKIVRGGEQGDRLALDRLGRGGGDTTGACGVPQTGQPSFQKTGLILVIRPTAPASVMTKP